MKRGAEVQKAGLREGTRGGAVVGGWGTESRGREPLRLRVPRW